MRTVTAVHVRRRIGLAAALVLIALAGWYLSRGSAGSGTRSSRLSARSGQRAGALSAPAPARSPTSKPTAPEAPPPPHLQVSPPTRLSSAWSTVARVHGAPAAWLAERNGTTLMRFEQSLVHLTLHAGSSDGGAGGWAYGDRVTRREIHLLLAAFNGGFKLTYPGTGFVSAGRVGAALHSGLGSIVTYTDGTTAIGAWRAGVPSARKTIYSVLQNQHLLVDRGRVQGSATTCILSCFGATIGSHTVVARSALGIARSGQLIWAAGSQLTPAGLGRALVAAGALRAVELDINPDWVAGYLYPHHPSGPSPVPVVPGQRGIAGQLLAPYARDFFAVIAN